MSEFFGALVTLTDLRNACNQGDKKKYDGIINGNKGKYEGLRELAGNFLTEEFESDRIKLFRSFINKDIYLKEDFDLKIAGQTLAKEFIPKLEEKALSLAKERGYIDKNFQYN